MDKNQLKIAAEWISKSKYLVAFTGAGISVESGIPAFRGEDGIWNKYDPEILEIDNYLRNPEETWPLIYKLFYQYFKGAKPNAAHNMLATLEKKGILKSVITQNIDNLHQEAGCSNIIEYHGNSNRMVCTVCGDLTEVGEEGFSSDIPRCKKENGLLKPDFVFFGEPIPQKAAEDSIIEIGKADVLLLIGTTGEVMPASMVPRMAKNNGAKIIEFNTERTVYTHEITDIFLKGKAGDIAEELVKWL